MRKMEELVAASQIAEYERTTPTRYRFRYIEKARQNAGLSKSSLL